MFYMNEKSQGFIVGTVKSIERLDSKIVLTVLSREWNAQTKTEVPTNYRIEFINTGKTAWMDLLSERISKGALKEGWYIGVRAVLSKEGVYYGTAVFGIGEFSKISNNKGREKLCFIGKAGMKFTAVSEKGSAFVSMAVNIDGNRQYCSFCFHNSFFGDGRSIPLADRIVRAARDGDILAVMCSAPSMYTSRSDGKERLSSFVDKFKVLSERTEEKRATDVAAGPVDFDADFDDFGGGVAAAPRTAPQTVQQPVYQGAPQTAPQPAPQYAPQTAPSQVAPQATTQAPYQPAQHPAYQGAPQSAPQATPQGSYQPAQQPVQQPATQPANSSMNDFGDFSEFSVVDEFDDLPF